MTALSNIYSFFPCLQAFWMDTNLKFLVDAYMYADAKWQMRMGCGLRTQNFRIRTSVVTVVVRRRWILWW